MSNGLHVVLVVLCVSSKYVGVVCFVNEKYPENKPRHMLCFVCGPWKHWILTKQTVPIVFFESRFACKHLSKLSAQTSEILCGHGLPTLDFLSFCLCVAFVSPLRIGLIERTMLMSYERTNGIQNQTGLSHLQKYLLKRHDCQ